jgi:hypothetical protein
VARQAIFRFIGSKIGIAKNLKKPRNLRKFADQSWQLVIHVAMTAYELKLLSAAIGTSMWSTTVSVKVCFSQFLWTMLYASRKLPQCNAHRRFPPFHCRRAPYTIS